MSVLKTHLSLNGFDVEIDYWNLRLKKMQDDFIWSESVTFGEDDINLFIYFNYLAIVKEDADAYKKIKTLLKSFKPQYLSLSNDFYDEHMKLYADKFDKLLDEVIGKYDFENTLYFGLEVNLYQWICASIVAGKIKEKSPSSIIVIGGIGTREAAEAFLKNFTQFDIAMWGEGEAPLLKLSNLIKDNNLSKLSEISNIAYRKDGQIVTTIIPNKEFIDLSSASTFLDYSEYFSEFKKYDYPKELTLLPFEGSRSCHWKKCHFCYLNSGYKYRVRDVKVTCSQIRESIGKYEVYRVFFLDNDLIGNNLGRYDYFLDELIKIKEQYPKFTVELGEIITKGINSSLIKKMSLAGFTNVQIGYESPSDNLLKKMDKKNTFSSNLLFLKFASEYKIKVNGANILKGLLEETSDDIIEGIDNLHYLRFLYNTGYFSHNMSGLAVMSASPYYKTVKKEIDKWVENPMLTYFPKNFLFDETKIVLVEYVRPIQNVLWSVFETIDKYYNGQVYSYTIYSINNCAIYREYFNGTITNEIEFDINSLEWSILTILNDEVTSLECLKDKLSVNYKVSDDAILEKINELSKERLIYCNTNNSELISIININKII